MSSILELVSKQTYKSYLNKSRGMQSQRNPFLTTSQMNCSSREEEETTQTLTVLCQRIWERKEWIESLITPLPKRGNLKQCQNYRTVSRISQTSKAILKVIKTHISTTVEELLAEEHTGFKTGKGQLSNQATVAS